LKILINSPVWYIAICIIIAVLGAYFLYRNDSKLKELPRGWKQLLGVFRFASLFCVFFLLLEPLLEYTKTKVDKPIVVLVQDNSSSVLSRTDSASFITKYTEDISQLSRQLSSEYEVVSYVFGKGINEGENADFKENSTNISRVFEEIQERYYNRNLGAIILSSDGIYNQGKNPVYEARKLKNIPVHTIRLGDSSPQKDVWIQEVFHNKLAYEGNTFLVEVSLNSNEINQKKTTVSLMKSGEVLSSKPLEVVSRKGIQKVQFEIEANEIGLQKYSVVVKEVEGEFTTVNNSSSFYVEVLQSKQKILLLAQSPHPDVQAIKNSLSSNENYEIEVKLIADAPKELDVFDLVITHNLPNKTNSFNAIKSSSIPILLVLGNQTDLRKLNELEAGLEIKDGREFTEAGTWINSNFTEFTLSDESINLLKKVSPLQVPFSTSYKLGNSFSTLLYQRIGTAKTSYALLSFGTISERKVGFFVGEGFWRWKIQEYAENESSAGFDGLIQQIAQLLVAKEDKSKFRVSGKPNYENSEDVTFSAELYNESYELVNTQEIEFDLVNEEKEVFQYLFSPKVNAYSLDLGRLPAGAYHYKASVKLENESLIKEGDFSVNETGLELKNTRANHELLYQISSETGGKSVEVLQIGSLFSVVTGNKNMVDVSYQEKEIDDLIELKFIFAIVLFFLSVEWFVRKRNGGY